MKKPSKRQQQLRKDLIKAGIIKGLICCAALVVPLLCLLLQGLGIPLPVTPLLISWPIALLTTGILIIIWTKRGKYGFVSGDAAMGSVFWIKRLSRQQEKTLNYILGSLLILLSVAFAVYSIVFLTA